MMDIKQEVARLLGLTVGELRSEYADVSGEPATSNNRTFLIKRILWKQQAAAQGGLTERARVRAAELARDQDLKMRPDRGVHEAVDNAIRNLKRGTSSIPAPGALLTRMYRGRRIEVRVLQSGFEWDGKTYRSLTAIAKVVTGSVWNGRLFFGLTSREATE